MDAQKEDDSAQVSTSGSPPSAHSVSSKDGAQNGEVNGANASEDVRPSKVSSKASSPGQSTPAASISENQVQKEEPTDATTAMDVDQPNQEAKTTDSESVQPSRKGSEEAAAAPYGTRSRNRPGRSRINYAEDTEMDFEMTAPASTNGNTSEPPSRSSMAAENGQSLGVGGKKGAGAGQGSAPWGNSGSNLKDTPATASITGSSAATPATSSSTAQPATKRRKNAAKDATNGVQASAAAPSQTAKRSAPAQAPSSATYSRETNMMTFESSGAMLRNGQLQADDGQIVSVNGKF
jgi:hypothetical protein